MGRTLRLFTVIIGSALLSGCVGWFFSGESYAERSRPVALIETTGGVELAATTEYGILLLGRTATSGACRVHYFIGPTPDIEDGRLEPTGAVFTRAEMPLKHQAVRVLDRSPTAADQLLAMWTPDGTNVRALDVTLATDDRVRGEAVLDDPGEELPAGAAVFRIDDKDRLYFVGLVAGKATFENPGSGSSGRGFYVLAGVDRVREMLAVPERYPVDYEPVYRPDGIRVLRPVGRGASSSSSSSGNDPQR